MLCHLPLSELYIFRNIRRRPYFGCTSCSKEKAATARMRFRSVIYHARDRLFQKVYTNLDNSSHFLKHKLRSYLNDSETSCQSVVNVKHEYFALHKVYVVSQNNGPSSGTNLFPRYSTKYLVYDVLWQNSPRFQVSDCTTRILNRIRHFVAYPTTFLMW